MNTLAHPKKSFLMRTLLVIATSCLALVVIVQIVLLVAINALNTGKAHDFIQTQVTSAMAPSGYNAIFDKLIYDPVRGFTLSNVTVLDKDGPIATVDRFSLDISFSKLPFRKLDMVGSSGNVHLIRMPEKLAETEAESTPPLEAFAVPNIYFKTIKITTFNIAHLNIDPAIAGHALSFSPTLKAIVKLGDKISVDASLLPKAENKISDVSLPEKMELVVAFTPSTLSFDLNNLLISSVDYRLTGKGQGQLAEGGMINVKIDGQYPDLKKLTQNNFESASLSLNIGADYQHPTINMDGVLEPASLKEKGLSPIQMNVTMDNVADNLGGTVLVATKYHEEPISLGAKLFYKDNVITINSLKGTAPQITVDGEGTLSTENNMFDGKLSLSANDLSYYKDLLSLDMAGNVKADVIFGEQNAKQSADVKASVHQFKLDGLTLEKADAELHFNDVQYPWPQTGNIQLSHLGISEGISVEKTSATIKDIGHEIYTLAFAGKAYVPSAVSFNGSADLSNMTNELPTMNKIDLKAILSKSTIVMTGAVDPMAVNLKISTKNFRGSDIPSGILDELSNIRLNGDVTMIGASNAPVTKAKVTMKGLDTGAYKNLNITADVDHQNDKVAFMISGKGAGIKTLTANTNFPLTFALWPFAFQLNMNAPLSGDIAGNLDLGTISTLFLPPTQRFSANLKTNGSIGGTIGEPDVKGSLVIRNGQFTDAQNGIELRSMNINSSFTKNSMIIDTITGTDGEKGLMKGSGHIDFSGDHNTDLSLSMKKFHLPKSNLADGMLDATFSLENENDGYVLKGGVDIASMNIIVPESFQSKIPELNIVDRKKSSADTNPAQIMSLAIKVNAPNQIFVRGWGLDAEFGGELDVSGDITSPLFNGSLASKRGRYEEFGKRFTLSRANLRFQGEIPPSPYLDIEATTPANDVTASIILTGPVTTPTITFSSTPVLPQDEVLSRLLFGQDTAKITPFQAIQLAQTLRRFSGEGGDSGLDPLGIIRSATGLDDISIDTDANGETNVGVGKYLTDKVYLEFEKGKAENSGAANIQIEVTPSINVQSEIGQDAQAGGGIFWKRDY